jgi:hypothetical protein
MNEKTQRKIENLIEEGMQDMSKAQKMALLNGIGGAGVGAIIANTASRVADQGDDEILAATLLGAGGSGAAKAAVSYMAHKKPAK